MATKKSGSVQFVDDVLVTSADLAAEVTGILPVANGGSGQSVYTNGQLLIGNTTGNTLTKSTLTAGSGISITNGAGSITIATTGGDVVGPASSTDNAVARFDLATGKLLQNSVVTIDDFGIVSGVLSINGNTAQFALKNSNASGLTYLSSSSSAFGVSSQIAIYGPSHATEAYRIIASSVDESASSAVTAVLDGTLERCVIADLGFGTGTALLELSSTTKGFLPPRLTTAQRDAITSPAEGLVLYNTTTDKLNLRNASAWEQVGTGDMVGPASATDNAVVRYDSTTGKLVQNSGVVIDDNNDVTGIRLLTAVRNGTAQLITSQSDTQAVFRCAVGTVTCDLTANTTEATLRTISNHPILFVTNSVERARIDTSGNVGIGTSSISASALLELSSTTKGFLPPRLTTAERDAISSPAEGLVVYNTTTDKLNLRNASTWEEVGGSGSSVVTIPIHAAAPTALTLTNQAVAEQFLANNNRNITRYTLTGFTEAKLVARVVTGSVSVNSPRLRVMYDLVSGGFSTNVANYASIASSGEIACSMTTAGVIDSGWLALDATALADVYIAVTQIGGDAAADPALGPVTLYLR